MMMVTMMMVMTIMLTMMNTLMTIMMMIRMMKRIAHGQTQTISQVWQSKHSVRIKKVQKHYNYHPITSHQASCEFIPATVRKNTADIPGPLGHR